MNKHQQSPGANMNGLHARQTARMRLPFWLRLFMPLFGISLVMTLTAGCVTLLWLLHHALHPQFSFESMSDFARSLIIFPPFFGALAPALMLMNILMRSIPPLRRILEESARGIPGASYQQAQRDLRKIATLLVPPALVLGLIGAVEPWAFLS